MGVGLRIAASWALPLPVLNAISFHARFESATAGRREAAVACLSDLFATDLGEPQPTFDEDLRRHAVVAELNLYPADLAQLHAKRPTVARAVESMTL
jgi:HD-like signal output (HDOD) protein